MSASSFMPIRSEPNAPSFEKATPCKLLKFFYELECLFHNAAIASEAEKKRHVLRYIDYELEQGWKCLFPEYAKATASYEDFRDAILVFYSVYSLRSMELLISDAQRVTLFTTSRLAEYHRQFLAITSWLIKKRQLEHSEQIRSYLRAFSPLIYLAITQHLQAKHPDHDIHVPYLITDVYDAAEFVLQSPLQCSPRTASPKPTARSAVKINNNQPHPSDFTHNVIRDSNQTTPNLAPSVTRPQEPVHDIQAISISADIQSSPSTPLFDHIDLEPLRDAHKPSAKPLASTISTSQPTVAQNIACFGKPRISIGKNLELVFHSSTVYQSPALSEIHESELDTPITITQDQFMALSSDSRAQILSLIAARKAEAPSTPLALPVTLSQHSQHKRTPTDEAELPTLHIKDQDAASIVFTSAQEERESCGHISDNLEPTYAHITMECIDTDYVAPLPDKATHTELAEPESYLVRFYPINRHNHSFLPSLARLSRSDECELMPIDIAQSAPFASSSSYSLGSAAYDFGSAFSPGPLPQSLITRTVTCIPPLALTPKGLPQHAIYNEPLASSAFKPLQSTYFRNPPKPLYLTRPSSYIASPDHFLHLASALGRIPKHAIPLKVIAYPPCQSLQSARFNSLAGSTTSLVFTMIHNSFSAKRIIAATLAPLYILHTHISRLFQLASPSIVAICSALSMRASTVNSVPLLVFLSIFSIVSAVMPSMRSLIYRFHDNIILAWSCSCIFALAIRDAYFLVPSEILAAPNSPSALAAFMTEDSQY